MRQRSPYLLCTGQKSLWAKNFTNENGQRKRQTSLLAKYNTLIFCWVPNNQNFFRVALHSFIMVVVCCVLRCIAVCSQREKSWRHFGRRKNLPSNRLKSKLNLHEMLNSWPWKVLKQHPENESHDMNFCIAKKISAACNQCIQYGKLKVTASLCS